MTRSRSSPPVEYPFGPPGEPGAHDRWAWLMDLFAWSRRRSIDVGDWAEVEEWERLLLSVTATEPDW